MNFIKLRLSPHNSYMYVKASNIAMNILGNFLSSDIRNDASTFKAWALYDKGNWCSSNITALEKNNHLVYLEDLYSEEEVPTRLEMTTQQFLQLLDEWEEKVCKKLPSEVIIKEENGVFSIETAK